MHPDRSTFECYRVPDENHVIADSGGWMIGDVRHSDIASLVARISASGLKPGTARQTHRVLAVTFESAVKGDRIARNPASRCPGGLTRSLAP